MKSERITLKQFNDPAFRRAQQMKVKSEAVWVAFHELEGLINVSRLAKEYFHRSQSWLSQKINGYNVNKQERNFTTSEYTKLTESFRDIAKRLNEYADAIDAAQEEAL